MHVSNIRAKLDRLLPRIFDSFLFAGGWIVGHERLEDPCDPAFGPQVCRPLVGPGPDRLTG